MCSMRFDAYQVKRVRCGGRIASQNQKIDTEKPIEKQFKHIYVPEVIREPKMHYWTVPRLGSYMAVPLVYKSCLSITAFDKSVTDYKVWQDAVKA